MTFIKKKFKYLTKKRCLNNKVNLKKTKKKLYLKNVKNIKNYFFKNQN